ncbi:cell division topological specificity factor MinE [Buchnera aphidicola (Ceratovacuna keduensis)]|uniref:cell division topological specificity factor MinE n=1 Tax=Buchnera aphidicola TaxID=9 RepID=UPI0031B84429
MSFLYFFYSNNKNTANIAKKRLNYIISKKQKKNFKVNNLKKLKNDIIMSMKKHLKIDYKMYNLKINEKKNKNFYILELYINLLKKDK